MLSGTGLEDTQVTYADTAQSLADSATLQDAAAECTRFHGMSDLDEIAARLRAAGSVYAEDEAAILAAECEDLEIAVARRIAGEPIEHIVGWAEFHGRSIVVGPGVFVPRLRSEFLVDRALLVVRPEQIVVELCCGAAAFATVLADTGADVYATDIDPGATLWAKRNIRPDRVFTGDLFDALPARLQGRVDLVVVNAPYVPTDAIATMPADAREFEPLVALDGGPDGLDLHRRIAADAATWLRPGGRLLIESSEGQAETSAALFRDAGLSARIVRDEDDDATVVETRRPSVEVAPGGADDPAVLELLRLGDEFGIAAYGPDGYYGLPVEELGSALLLVARRDGTAVGTAALVDRGDGTAELKRMFVRADVRRLGAASALLDAVEREARARGIRLMRLETGPKQPEAIALYAGHGYEQIPQFGRYVGDPDSYCMQKSL